MSTKHELTDERLARMLESDPWDVEDLRAWFRMTQGEVASVLGRSPRTIARWKALGDAVPTRASAELSRSVRKLGRVRYLLDDLMPHELALRWLQAPNPGFRGEAPVDLMMSGHIDDVIAALEALADGGAY